MKLVFKQKMFLWFDSYDIFDGYDNSVDTYTINSYDPQDALNALMLVLAIDAEKCSRKD